MTTEASQQDDKAKIWASLDQEEAGVKPAAADDEQKAVATEQQQTPKTDESQEAASADKPAAEQQPAASDKGAAGDDPYAGLPQAVRDEIVGLKTMFTQVTGRLRNAEGQIGGLKSALSEARAQAQAAGSDAPSASALREAQANPRAMAKLLEDYPEFGAAMKAAMDEQLAALRSELKPAKTEQASGVSPADLKKLHTEIVVEVQHPGWKDRVQTPQFRGWLEGQPREVQMLAASDEPADAIRLLDLEKEARTKGSQQRTQRLDAAASIPGGRSAPQSRAKPVEQMTAKEYWAYLDQLDAQQPRG